LPAASGCDFLNAGATYLSDGGIFKRPIMDSKIEAIYKYIHKNILDTPEHKNGISSRHRKTFN